MLENMLKSDTITVSIRAPLARGDAQGRGDYLPKCVSIRAPLARGDRVNLLYFMNKGKLFLFRESRNFVVKNC
jgi:hypothetical protein